MLKFTLKIGVQYAKFAQYDVRIDRLIPVNHVGTPVASSGGLAH
jgi:hypothetical protein